MNYKYIEDNQYSRLFPLYQENNKTNLYHIHFCMYNINTELYIEGNRANIDDDYLDIPELYNAYYPFLQFVVEKKDTNEYIFPTIDYVSPNIEELSDDDERSPLQIHFENTCFQTIFNMFTDISEIHMQNIQLEQLYKGFITHDDNHIFVLFDIGSLIHQLKPSYTLAIIDELVFKQKIYDVSVSKLIIQFFKTNNELRYIKTVDGHDYPFPFQLYMLNIKKEETVLKESRELIIPGEHNRLGLAYYFSTNPINATEMDCKRFSCFIVKCLYDIVLKDSDLYYNDELIDDENTSFTDKLLAATTFYFHEKEVQYWGVKNVLHFCEI